MSIIDRPAPAVQSLDAYAIRLEPCERRGDPIKFQVYRVADGVTVATFADYLDAEIECGLYNAESTLDHAEPFEPTAEDLEDYRQYLASRTDLAVQAIEPTPLDVLDLDVPEDADEADFDDWGPWWEDLPDAEPIDGGRYGLGSEPEPAEKVRGLDASTAWALEGRGVRGSTSWNPEADAFANV